MCSGSSSKAYVFNLVTFSIVHCIFFVPMAESCARSAVAVVQCGAIFVHVNEASALPTTIKALDEVHDADESIMHATVTQMPRHRQSLLMHDLLQVPTRMPSAPDANANHGQQQSSISALSKSRARRHRQRERKKLGRKRPSNDTNAVEEQGLNALVPSSQQRTPYELLALEWIEVAMNILQCEFYIQVWRCGIDSSPDRP